MLARAALLPARTSRPLWVLLVLAAVAVSVAGYLHGHLYHEGYSQVSVVGPLFLLNEIATGLTVCLLILRRLLLFTLGVIGISVGSVVSILISHNSSFFGFAEHRYDGRAQAIVVAEIIAAVLGVAIVAIARGGLLPSPDSQ